MGKYTQEIECMVGFDKTRSHFLWCSEKELGEALNNVGEDSRAFIRDFIEDIDEGIRQKNFLLRGYDESYRFFESIIAKYKEVDGFIGSSLHKAILAFFDAVNTEKDNDLVKSQTLHTITEYLLFFNRCDFYWNSLDEA